MDGFNQKSSPDPRVIAVLEAAMHLQHVMTFSLCGGRCTTCANKIEVILDQLDTALIEGQFEDASVFEGGEFIHGDQERAYRAAWPDGSDDEFGPDLFDRMFATGGFAFGPDIEVMFGLGGFDEARFTEFRGPEMEPQPHREMPTSDDLEAVLQNGTYVVIMTG